MDCCPYGSIHLSQPYLTQIIIMMNPVTDKSSAMPNPTVKPTLAKSRGYQLKMK